MTFKLNFEQIYEMFQLEFYILVTICFFNIHARLQCSKWWMWKCPHEVSVHIHDGITNKDKSYSLT